MNIGSTTGSAYTTAAQTLNQGTSQVERAAQEVVDATTARPVEGTGKVASAMVDLKEAEVTTEAGAKVLQAADKSLGSLIDIEA
ncbi:hypothetical protein [Thalassolituus marinus]|uniref:Chemotaxis protein n=1 Tax=Thalassolituus marinus TaxID=671053 RepID=A0ABS7ZU24_9GAMM|nr:hypothetical protein [Thalassolituus marinus]MCA6065082.1 hypothetical protein [Thalassolituus marinus]